MGNKVVPGNGVRAIDSHSKESLINLAKDLFGKFKKNPTIKELEKQGIFYDDIRKLFKNFREFLLACGFFPKKVRKPNLTDEELKEYLKEIKTINLYNSLCPSYQKLGTVCAEGCSCWISDKYYIDLAENRQTIRYKDKKLRLHQLSYLVFIGPLPIKPMEISHKCDNSRCFNPDHLEALTHQKNMQQCAERGRIFISNSSGRIQHHKLKDPYNFLELLSYAKDGSTISSLNEWLWNGKTKKGYPVIGINGKSYRLGRLILANKLSMWYEDVVIARHVLPDGSEGRKHDLNPEHLCNGTNRDNSNDRRKKWALLNNDVLLILEELKENPLLKRGDAKIFDLKMAQRFNVSTSVIKKVRLGTAYKVYSPDINKQANSGTTGRPIIQLDLDRNFISRYDGATIAAKKFNCNYTAITNACSGRSKTAIGFIWVYEDQYIKLIANNETH